MPTSSPSTGPVLGEKASPSTSRNTRQQLISLVLALALFGLIASLLWAGGVFKSELGREWDESGHYLNAILVRDYVAQGFPGTPMEFAKNYYLHYPKIAFGHWPPFFYVVQCVWMFLFGTSRTAVLYLMAAMSTAIAFTLYRLIRDRFQSALAGVAVAALFLCIPAVQKYTGTLMADIPVAMFSFWALLCWIRYMETKLRKPAILFALFSAAAILTKGNGFALVFLPPIAILLTRSWWVLKDKSFWLSVGLMGALCLPWNVLTRNLIVPTMQYDAGLGFLVQGGWFYLRTLLVIPGLLTSLFALLGIWARVVLPFRKGTLEPLWASSFAAMVGVEVFHASVPAGFEDRYLLASLPLLLLFMVAGVVWVCRQVPAGSFAMRATVCAVTIAGLFLGTTFRIARKYSYGFEGLAQELVSNPEYRDAVILCSSNDNAEGLLISEMAMREKRPGHIILRASRMLASSDWNGKNYKLIKSTPKEVEDFLESVPVGLLVVDQTPTTHERYSYHDLVQQVAASGRWTKVGTFPKVPQDNTVEGARIELYRTSGPIKPAGALAVELRPNPEIRVVKSSD